MARKSMSAIKKEKQELLNSMKNDIKNANFRLAMLEKYYGKDSWSSTILKKTLNRKKIQGLSLSGRVKADESMSLEQLRAIEKATKNFLTAKSSTYQGIKKIKKSVIRAFRSKYGDIDNNKLQRLSLEDAEILYSVLEDEETANVVENLGSSRMLTLLASNIKKGATKKDFYKSLSNIIDKSTLAKDKETKKALERIYKKISKE